METAIIFFLFFFAVLTKSTWRKKSIDFFFLFLFSEALGESSRGKAGGARTTARDKAGGARTSER